MSETNMKILENVSKAFREMTPVEKERLLWFSEGLAAAARAQGTAEGSA